MARRQRLGAVLAAGLVFLSASPAQAAMVPQYDITLNRTRSITSAQSALSFYSPDPVYLQIPGGTTSDSTPTVIGNTAYQYTFTTGGQGYLSAIQIPTLTANQVLQHAYGKGYWIQAAQYAQPVVKFSVGFSPSGQNEAAGQDSLSTGPYSSISRSGTVAGGTAYQAIAVGEYLYTWPQSQYPTGGSPSGQQIAIKGNPNNTDYQVDVNPLITPPVTVTGIDLTTGQTTTWQSPVAVAESWDGGAVAYPTYTPQGDHAFSLDYFTNQSGQYPHSTAPLTSDPTWIGSVPGLGSAVVAFGVAGAHPRVILWNVTTGQYKAIGVGEIATKIWDATLFDAANTTLYAQDAYGNLYGFNVDSGTLTAVYGDQSGWTNYYNLIIAKDLALLGNTLYAVGGGNNALGAFSLSMNLQPWHISNAYGPNVSSPATLTDASGQTLVVINNAQGGLWLEAPENLWALNGGTFNQTATVPIGSTYIGFTPDAGRQHDLIGWTNRDPAGQPALVVYVPQPYQVQLTLSQSTVSSGHSVTLTAWTIPPSVTYDDGNNPYSADRSGAPVAYQIVGPGGYLAQPGAPMQHSQTGVWTATWTPPSNTSLQPATYTITVTAIDELGQTAQATATLTVDPVQPTTANTANDGTLTLTCGYGHGSPQIKVPHTCTIPPYLTGNSPAWFAANPEYGAKFGDTIDVHLQIPPPNLPSGDVIDTVQLTASVPYTQGVPNAPGYRGYVPGTGNLYNDFPATAHLTQNGEYTAKGWLIESWDGYPPKENTANVGDTYTLSASWHAVAYYHYTVYYACGTAKHPATCSRTVYAQDAYSGTASAPLTVNGTDYYVIATPMGY